MLGAAWQVSACVCGRQGTCLHNLLSCGSSAGVGLRRGWVAGGGLLGGGRGSDVQRLL
jgi:hypothetical protein